MAVNLAAAQLEAGHDARIYCISGEGALAEDARRHGIPIRDFGKGAGISVRTVAEMAWALREDKAEVVHTHNPAAHYYGAIAGFFSRTAAIVNTRHSPVSSRGDQHREWRFARLLSITDQVAFVSEHARRAIAPAWGNARVLTSVIANGIPISTFRKTPAQPGHARPRIVFGSIGRLAPVKAHDVLLRAFRRLSDQCPEARLRIIGDGPSKQSLELELERLGLGATARIDPATSDVARVLSELDILVVSSHSEGLPMIVLEAMAAGLPIVSTRVGGIPEVAPEGEIAWFCEPGNPDALAEAMLSAQACNNLAEKGRMAAGLAASFYDAARMAAQYEALYTSILEWRRR